jgi:rhodanese-related sulfurtransferase
MSPQHLLIDVRTPSEFATGFLTSDLATPTVNIEYQSIGQLASIYAAQGIVVGKSDHVTLYCRSGRRSDIAMRELRLLGWENVRDIGGFEEARRTLDRETVARQLDGGVEGENDRGAEGEEIKEGGEEEGEEKGEKRQQSFGALLDGLKALDG